MTAVVGFLSREGLREGSLLVTAAPPTRSRRIVIVESLQEINESIHVRMRVRGAGRMVRGLPRP